MCMGTGAVASGWSESDINREILLIAIPDNTQKRAILATSSFSVPSTWGKSKELYDTKSDSVASQLIAPVCLLFCRSLRKLRTFISPQLSVQRCFACEACSTVFNEPLQRVSG